MGPTKKKAITKMVSNNNLQSEVHRDDDEANSITQLTDKIDKSQKELGDKIDKLIKNSKRQCLILINKENNCHIFNKRRIPTHSCEDSSVHYFKIVDGKQAEISNLGNEITIGYDSGSNNDETLPKVLLP